MSELEVNLATQPLITDGRSLRTDEEQLARVNQETAVDAGARIEDSAHDGGQKVPHYQDATVTLHHGDCLDVLAELPDASIDAVVTDPPYLLGFMGKQWDTRAGHEHLDWHRAWCDHAFRVLKPGGHLLAFGGTRTWHRLACAVEDAGFEVRDSIAWLYGSGFPKSLDVSKAIDKAAGAEREVVGRYQPPNGSTWNLAADESAPGDGGTMGAFGLRSESMNITAPATPDAARWQGWGTALKPAFEPVVVARKPLSGTVAQTVLAHGTGALNIDACRVDSGGEAIASHHGTKGGDVAFTRGGSGGYQPGDAGQHTQTAGRWPANVVLDDTQAAALDEQSAGTRASLPSKSGSESGDKFGGTAYGVGLTGQGAIDGYDDQGGASRFFYVAKAPTAERVKVDGIAHPTVKPLALMRWLVRLVTPPGGTVLEPFAGSGTTVEACILEGFHVVAIEREADYLPLIAQRIHRRKNPVEAVRGSLTQEDDDMGLFDLLDQEGPAA